MPGFLTIINYALIEKIFRKKKFVDMVLFLIYPLSKFEGNGTIVIKEEWLGSPANIKLKEQTKMPRFRLEGHNDRAKSFVLRSYTMRQLRNQHVSIGSILSSE